MFFAEQSVRLAGTARQRLDLRFLLLSTGHRKGQGSLPGLFAVLAVLLVELFLLLPKLIPQERIEQALFWRWRQIVDCPK